MAKVAAVSVAVVTGSVPAVAVLEAAMIRHADVAAVAENAEKKAISLAIVQKAVAVAVVAHATTAAKKATCRRTVLSHVSRV